MIYGVKVIHTHIVGENEQRFYEELILRVVANSFEDAYEKAEKYMEASVCDYTNVFDQKAKTLKIEAVDCYEVWDAEGDVEEVFSTMYRNRTSLNNEEYYEAISVPCDKEGLYPLRNKDFN